MSYNESLMSNSNYPPMSQSEWDSAPWNEESIPEKDFDLIVCQTLSKQVDVTTSDYNPEYDEEDGSIFCDTSETSWKEVYADNKHYTPLELIGLFGRYIDDLLNDIVTTPRSPSFLKILKQECKGWQEEEIDFN